VLVSVFGQKRERQGALQAALKDCNAKNDSSLPKTAAGKSRSDSSRNSEDTAIENQKLRQSNYGNRTTAIELRQSNYEVISENFVVCPFEESANGQTDFNCDNFDVKQKSSVCL